MKGSELNSNAENTSGARANISYGNIYDQKRYFHALNFTRDKDVLDCACGIGWGSCLIANGGAKSVTGIDLCSIAIESAKEFYSSSNLKFVLGTSNDFDETTKFDVITSFETLEHVDDPINFLKSLKKVLKPGGVLLLSTPNGHCLKHDHTKPYNQYHVEEYTKEELIKLLEQSGWILKKYMGQKHMRANSKEVSNYRNFTKNYWLNNKYSNKFGLMYKIINRVFNIISSNIDPAKTHTDPVEVENGYEPAYHFIIAQ